MEVAMMKRTMDTETALKLEDISTELEGVSNLMLVMHGAFENEKSVPSEVAIMSTLWSISTYLQRIANDVNEILAECSTPKSGKSAKLQIGKKSGNDKEESFDI